MKSLLLSSLMLLTGLASAEPFASADANAGKALVAKSCVSCHAESFGGDGSSIYTREFRKVKTSKGLVAQVRNCNTMIGLKWFEDEELNAAKYLNQTYYKFTE
ncbi:cytochrome c [Methylotenera sp.]|uniref:c-type cytochrome n=1 Tax=Methylotenera sp. TaxID=2051956 RepID=UPI002489FEA2|nr:cytochrome c [Methylotenera sp.]MDI1362422.1 cytochrome c [Methylotenera sp.]